MNRVSFDAMTAVIGNIYATAEDPGAWHEVIAQMRAMFDASQCCFGWHSLDPQRGYAVSTNPNPRYIALYLEVFSTNPLMEAFEAAPVGAIYRDHALVGRERLRDSRFWNEWMAPQDMYDGLGCKLLKIGRETWFFDMQRGRAQPVFDEADVALFQHIVPHLIRASELSWTLQMQKIRTTTFSLLPLGLLIVDDHMRIIEANTAAEQILARPDAALTVKSGLLEAAAFTSNRALRDMIATACARPDETIPPSGGNLLIPAAHRGKKIPDIAVTVTPLPDAAGGIRFGPLANLTIREITLELPSSFEDTIRLLYGLTPKEAQLAMMLASGKSLKDAAGEQGIRFSTARSHLERIFRKTGTGQQHQLVALLRIAAAA